MREQFAEQPHAELDGDGHAVRTRRSYCFTHDGAQEVRFGGHGGSEALPEEKIDRDPWLKRMFLGYAFSIDYRDRLIDAVKTVIACAAEIIALWSRTEPSSAGFWR